MSPICPVCGCREVRVDEAQDPARILLAECPRCDHRWTRRCEPARLVRTRVESGVEREVASAA